MVAARPAASTGSVDFAVASSPGLGTKLNGAGAELREDNPKEGADVAPEEELAVVPALPNFSENIGPGELPEADVAASNLGRERPRPGFGSSAEALPRSSESAGAELELLLKPVDAAGNAAAADRLPSAAAGGVAAAGAAAEDAAPAVLPNAPNAPK